MADNKMEEIKCCSPQCHPANIPIEDKQNIIKSDFFTNNSTKFSDIYSTLYNQMQNQNKELNINLDKIISLRVICEKLNYDMNHVKIEVDKNKAKSIFKEFSEKYLEVIEIYNSVNNINNCVININELACLFEHPSKLGNNVDYLINNNKKNELDTDYLSNYMIDTNIMPFSYITLDNNNTIKTLREKIAEHSQISNLIVQRLMSIIQECNNMRNNLAKKLRLIPLV